jgi:serine/threonine protein kinase
VFAVKILRRPMASDRWNKIKSLYIAAQQLQPAHRSAFLQSACEGDEEIRQEVESLLRHGDQADVEAFLEKTNVQLTKPGDSWSGRRVGPYIVGERIGAGGMGEVYRASDTKLGRDVCFKVLPASFVEDPDRRKRFQTEARSLAALNHPNIAAIYGFDEVGSECVIILELVEGPTLEARLKSGPIPFSDALRIARQIVDALEAAHAKAIIHRDLKPANIKFTTTGAVKVLDFGLAKALVRGTSSALSQAPTGTGRGVILGTPAYMSPEQASGQTDQLDERTDIWALGCVLFEMLTGSRPFPGDSTAQTLGAVLSREPEWQLLPRSTPETVKSLLRRCLAKDPKQRLHHVADVRLEIDHILAGPTSVKRRVTVSRRSIAVATTAVLAVIIVLFMVRAGINTVSRGKGDQPFEIRERQITSNPIEDPIAFAAISPDGKFVAYNDSTAIRIRLIDTGETRALVVPPDFCFI